MSERPRPPAHLSKPARRLFSRVTGAYLMEDSDRTLLVTALEAWDRAQQAREAIDREGLTVATRFGESKAHPLLAVERDARAAFLQAMRALHLDYEPVSNDERTARARAARWAR